MKSRRMLERAIDLAMDKIKKRLGLTPHRSLSEVTAVV